MNKNDSWAVPIIIFLLIMIAGKLHVFDGLFSATSMVTGLAVGLFVIYGKQAVAICAIVIAVVVAWLMLAENFSGFR